MPALEKIILDYPENFIASEQTRADCYLLLARCFQRPNRIMLLRQQRDNALAIYSRQSKPNAAKYARLWQQALINSTDQELDQEHCRLFNGPVPPVASCYLESERARRKKHCAATRQIYTRFGLIIPDTASEPADHIAIELEFMHYLIALRMDALQAGDEEVAEAILPTEQLFFHDHLLVWITPFCNAIRTHTTSDFYRHTANCLELLVGKSPPLPKKDPTNPSPEGF